MSLEPMPADAPPGARPAAPSTLMASVYQWMALGLGTSGAAALAVQRLPRVERAIVGSPAVWLLLMGTVAMAVALQGYATRMSASMAFVVLFAYSALLGVAVAPIYWRYTEGSIGSTFLVVGAMFAVIGLYGRATRRDVAHRGSFVAMGVVGAVLASLVNAIVLGGGQRLLYWPTAYVGVIVFTGLAAFDAPRLERLARVAASRFALQGATILYLDFVNIFVLLPRAVGRTRD